MIKLKVYNDDEKDLRYTRKKLFIGFFKSYVDIANFLDKHKEFKNKLIYAKSSNGFKLSAIRKINFDGTFTNVEGLGSI